MKKVIVCFVMVFLGFASNGFAEESLLLDTCKKSNPSLYQKVESFNIKGFEPLTKEALLTAFEARIAFTGCTDKTLNTLINLDTMSYSTVAAKDSFKPADMPERIRDGVYSLAKIKFWPRYSDMESEIYSQLTAFRILKEAFTEMQTAAEPKEALQEQLDYTLHGSFVKQSITLYPYDYVQQQKFIGQLWMQEAEKRQAQKKSAE